MPASTAPLLAAATTFSTLVPVGLRTAGHTGARVDRVVGPLDTTVTLLESKGRRVCLVASHFGTSSEDISYGLRLALAAALKLPMDQIVVISSHNHSVPLLEKRPLTGFEEDLPRTDPTPLGKRFIKDVIAAARPLGKTLQPVTVWYAQGREGRISYNRKGHRADASAYFIREEDRQRIAKDYRGDIDEEAPVIVLKGRDGRAVTALVQFNAHPVTVYNAEKLTVCGDWPQVACRMVADALGGGRGRATRVPVSFLQGCAGDVNSKHMFSGDIKLSERYGRYLGATYMKAARSLRPSERQGMDFTVVAAPVPLAPLPSAAVLGRELREMEDFARRAAAGDEDTLTCVGLNFPRSLSPAYRGKLVEYVAPWNRWALALHKRGKAHTVRKHFDVDVQVLRLGDVGIVGMSCEPFTAIGRQVRAGSPLPLTIPCGYFNGATGYIGYITDGPNTGDREYMSTFYRYTRFVPPFKKPAGDVIADKAVEVLKRFVEG